MKLDAPTTIPGIEALGATVLPDEAIEGLAALLIDLSERDTSAIGPAAQSSQQAPHV